MRSWLMTVVLAALLSTFAFAQGNDAAPAPAAVPAADAAAAAAAPPAGAAKGAVVVGSAHGYLKTTPEAEALWKQLVTAQTDLYTKQWELYVLINAQPLDKKAARAKYGEVRALSTQMRKLREQLKTYWQPLDETILGAKHTAAKAGGKKPGHKKNDAAGAQPATPAAPPAQAGGQ